MAVLEIEVQNGLQSKELFILVAAAAVAIWSTVSLTIRIFTVLNRRSGLYFYGLLFSSWGISVRQIGILTVYLAPRCPWVIRRFLIESGWVAMVSGFSLVLYSRLSIVLQSHRTRRAILIMILINGVTWHPMVITINAAMRYLKNTEQLHRLQPWDNAHEVVERIVIVMFNGQEILMAFFYVRAAYRYLNNGFTKKDKVRNAMCLLIVVSAIVFAVDVFIVSLDISGHMRLKTFLHSFVYTIKLELEFVNLNQLVRISRMGSPGTTSWTSPADIEAQNERVPKRQSGIVTVQRDSAMSMQSWDAVKFITTPKSLSSL